jgi:hypothetical protein
MSNESAPIRPARMAQPRPAVTGQLPHWNHLPLERRRELTATLATLIVNRLARPQPEEGQHE